MPVSSRSWRRTSLRDWRRSRSTPAARELSTKEALIARVGESTHSRRARVVHAPLARWRRTRGASTTCSATSRNSPRIGGLHKDRVEALTPLDLSKGQLVLSGVEGSEFGRVRPSRLPSSRRRARVSKLRHGVPLGGGSQPAVGRYRSAPKNLATSRPEPISKNGGLPFAPRSSRYPRLLLAKVVATHRGIPSLDTNFESCSRLPLYSSSPVIALVAVRRTARQSSVPRGKSNQMTSSARGQTRSRTRE